MKSWRRGKSLGCHCQEQHPFGISVPELSSALFMGASKFKSVTEYFSSVPGKQRNLLRQLRTAIQQAAPVAEEVISYNMPAFRFHGMLVYYAAFKDHVSLFPTGAMKAFQSELKNYKTSKGTIQFQIGDGVPIGLVKKIVRFRVKENLAKESLRKNRLRRS